MFYIYIYIWGAVRK